MKEITLFLFSDDGSARRGKLRRRKKKKRATVGEGVSFPNPSCGEMDDRGSSPPEPAGDGDEQVRLGAGREGSEGPAEGVPASFFFFFFIIRFFYSTIHQRYGWKETTEKERKTSRDRRKEIFR